MKKTLTINISGTVFHIEEDAYDKLKTYLSKISDHFSNEEGGQEIINDIEARISELFSQRTSFTSDVVTNEMVHEVIEIMGLPEDFDTADETESNSKSNTGYSYNQYRQGKRLYRDPESRVIGGVCSGLAHFLNMDKILVRILFFILFLITSGAALLAYIILWIAVPKAKSTSQRLEMKGEKINVENIGKTVKEEFSEMKDSYSKFKSSEEYAKSREYARNVGRNAQHVGREASSVIVKIFGAIFLIIGFLSLVGLIFGILAATSIIGLVPGFHEGIFVNHLYSGGMASTLMISIFIIAAIPLLLIIYAGTKMLFNYVSSNKTIVLSAIGVWIIAIILAIATGIGAVDVFSENATSTDNYKLETTADTIFISINEDSFRDITEPEYSVNNFSIVKQDDKEILIARPKFTIIEADNDLMELKLRKESKGNNYRAAKDNAQDISYSYRLEGSKLILDPYFKVGSGEKWRSQELDLTLKLPVGKVVYLNENLLPIINDIENTSNTWDGDMLSEFWEMKNEGLTLVK